MECCDSGRRGAPSHTTGSPRLVRFRISSNSILGRKYAATYSVSSFRRNEILTTTNLTATAHSLEPSRDHESALIWLYCVEVLGILHRMATIIRGAEGSSNSHVYDGEHTIVTITKITPAALAVEPWPMQLTHERIASSSSSQAN